MRAVLDVNVIISAVLSPRGAPARTLEAWIRGEFELVTSPRLVAELEHALSYAKIADRISATDRADLVDLLAGAAVLLDDPTDPPPARCADPGDDYLIALAASARAVIVSGDRHLTDLSDQLPIHTPAQFMALLEGQ